MKFITLAFFILLSGCAGRNKTPAIVSPMIVFELSEGILHPESAVYSPEHKLIYVSNVASGNPTETKRVGYLSLVSPLGKMIKSKWITGLKAPKGIAIKGNDLWVSDVNQIVKIDIKKGKINRTYTVKGAKFLNDVVIDAAGVVYVSDMGTNIIHKIEKDVLSVWLESTKLRGPNGLFTDGKEHMIVAMWGSEPDPKTFVTKNNGALAAISLKSPTDNFIEEKGLRGHLDGISVDGGGTLWVSDWISGDIFKVGKNGKSKKVFNFGQGTADIFVAKELKLLLVPQMAQNKLIALKIP